MNFLRLPVALLLTGVLGLAGCSMQQPASLYQLDSGEPGQPKQNAGLAVLLGPVSVADYLQREKLLQRQPDRFAQWSFGRQPVFRYRSAVVASACVETGQSARSARAGNRQFHA